MAQDPDEFQVYENPLHVNVWYNNECRIAANFQLSTETASYSRGGGTV